MLVYPVNHAGIDLGKMSEVLEEIKDWEELATKLELRTSQRIAISETCSSSSTPVQCQRRMLLRTYCDMMGLVEVEVVAESIAHALDAIHKPQLAARMKILFHKDGKLHHVCEMGWCAYVISIS